jgi:hypothetical protein
VDVSNYFHSIGLVQSHLLRYDGSTFLIGSWAKFTITINVPLVKKLRDIIFFCGTITLWAISRDILRGRRLLTP